MQELISIQKYASKHHISIFNVIKKTMSGELPTVVKEENGKEVTYIVMNPASPQPQNNLNSVDNEAFEIDYKKAYDDLNKEYLILKTKYDKLLAVTQGEN